MGHFHLLPIKSNVTRNTGAQMFESVLSVTFRYEHKHGLTGPYNNHVHILKDSPNVSTVLACFNIVINQFAVFQSSLHQQCSELEPRLPNASRLPLLLIK